MPAGLPVCDHLDLLFTCSLVASSSWPLVRPPGTARPCACRMSSHQVDLTSYAHAPFAPAFVFALFYPDSLQALPACHLNPLQSTSGYETN